ncbi:MAG: terminase large subunit, partial [Erysipelotrichaceae bacterium]
MTYLEQYFHAIEAGEIIVGQELYGLLIKLIAEMQDPRYRYETKKAHRRIKFIELFCKHTKSPFNGKPFLLELWEKAFIEVTYSFIKVSTGYRRFKKIILLISRKNGKSTLAAGMAFSELMIGNGGSDIVCSSNDDGQASIIFQEIGSMREMFDPNDKRTHKNLRWILNKKNKSKVFK